MGRAANFSIVRETPEYMIIRDVGPWDVHLSVTNDAESVVRRLSRGLGRRRLLYFDSEGVLDEIIVRNGQFAGFQGLPPEWNEWNIYEWF